MPDITRATRQDEERVKGLLEESKLPFEDLTPAHLDTFLTLYNGDQLVGCVGLENFGEHALLRSLVVRAGYRSQGLGSRLLASAETLADTRGVHTLYLLTTTAEVFFARHGYLSTERGSTPQAIQMTAEFKSMCPASAVCMYKRLLIHSS